MCLLLLWWRRQRSSPGSLGEAELVGWGVLRHWLQCMHLSRWRCRCHVVRVCLRRKLLIGKVLGILQLCVAQVLRCRCLPQPLLNPCVKVNFLCTCRGPWKGMSFADNVCIAHAAIAKRSGALPPVLFSSSNSFDNLSSSCLSDRTERTSIREWSR